jgi:hypothetical protein
MKTWIQKLGRGLAILARVIIAVLAAVGAFLIVRALVKASRGKVKSPQPFAPVPGRSDQIDVSLSSGPVRVQLPDGVTSNQVLAVQVVPGGAAVVEVVHAKDDRRAALAAARRARGNG